MAADWPNITVRYGQKGDGKEKLGAPEQENCVSRLSSNIPISLHYTSMIFLRFVEKKE